MRTKFILFLLAILLILGVSPVSFAQDDDDANALDYIPPSRFISGWEASGNEMIAGPRRAAWLIGDELDLLLEFDLLYYATETYTHGNDEMTVEIFEFNASSDAFGFYSLSYIQPPDPEAIEVTPPYGPPPQSTVETVRRIFAGDEECLEAYKDRFYIRIKTTEEYLELSGTQAALYILARIPGTASQAGFLGILPSEGRVVGTERYFLGPYGLDRIMDVGLYDLFGDDQYDWKAAAAEYRAGGGEYYLLIGVEYEDEETADSMRGSVMDYFEDRRYQPVRLQQLESGVVPYGYSGENHVAVWSDGDKLWLVWDAGSIDVLNTALEQFGT